MTRTHFSDELDRTERETDVSRRDVLRRGATALAVTVGLAGLSTSAAAEQGGFYDLMDSADGTLDKGFASLKGAAGRLFADEDKRTAGKAARETTDVFNANSSTLVTYANDQLGSSREKTSYDTIRVEFSKEKTAKRWIVADVDENNAFAAANMVDSKPEREIDHWVKLEKLAASDAPDELERFVDQYATENRPIDAKLQGRFAGRYGPDVESSLL